MKNLNDHLIDLVNDIMCDAVEPGGSYIFAEEWASRIRSLVAGYVCDGSTTCKGPVHIHGCYARHRADECDSPKEYGHI